MNENLQNQAGFTTSNNAELTTPYSFSQTRQKKPENEIPRDVLIETLDEQLLKNDVIILDGPSGVGKTNFLDQFSRLHAETTIALFLDRASGYSLNSDVILRDLCGQLYWYVYSEDIPFGEAINESMWYNLVYETTKKIKRKSCFFYIIIDGIESIQAESAHVIELLCEIVPFGRDLIKVILSDDFPKRSKFISDKIPLKSFLIYKLTLMESSLFLENCSEEEKKKLYKLSEGLPGKLDSIKRLIQDGNTAAELISDITEKNPNFFRLEWKIVDERDATTRKLLGSLALTDRCYSPDWMARLCGITINEVINRTETFSFLVLDKTSNTISYVNESIRRYAAKRLANYKEEIIGDMVDSILGDKKNYEDSSGTYATGSN